MRLFISAVQFCRSDVHKGDALVHKGDALAINKNRFLVTSVDCNFVL